jgi:hypothetical protein
MLKPVIGVPRFSATLSPFLFLKNPVCDGRMEFSGTTSTVGGGLPDATWTSRAGKLRLKEARDNLTPN